MSLPIIMNLGSLEHSNNTHQKLISCYHCNTQKQGLSPSFKQYGEYEPNG